MALSATAKRSRASISRRLPTGSALGHCGRTVRVVHKGDRVREVLAAAGLRDSAIVAPIESYSNDVYRIEHPERGAAVLRICWQGCVDRRLVECDIGSALQDLIGYPEVIERGRAGPLAWSISVEIVEIGRAHV